MSSVKAAEAEDTPAVTHDRDSDVSEVVGRGPELVNLEKELQFKAHHRRMLVLLTWILFIHALGIYFFTKGFLLTRLVLDHKSECGVLPGQEIPFSEDTEGDGCWHPKSFDKAVVILVDALRYDFTVPMSTDQVPKPPHYRNALNVLYNTAVEQPRNAFLLPFIADPPTTTLQRLKGLTTGTLPTFVDAGTNFAGTAIEEDNLIAQLREAGKNVVHLGDDTWQSLFPGYFDGNLSRPYDSFNVWDLHTVDNGVTEHLFPLLHPSNTTKWDVIFGHYLGVDHAGHRYGPDHPAMAAKLRQMDALIEQTIECLDDSTLLVVMGDHGMDAKGDHGGESDDEVQAALWMYSKKGIFGRGSPEDVTPPKTAKERPVWQIDLVPTLAMLLGLPIPFNNLGTPIKEAFLGQGQDWQNLAAATGVTAAQIRRYQHEYALARGLPEATMSKPMALWEQARKEWVTATESSQPTGPQWKSVHESLVQYQAETLRICKDLWARFDIPSMLAGITILFIGVILLVACARGQRSELSQLLSVLPGMIIKGSSGGLVTGGILSRLIPLGLHAVDGALLCAAVSLCGIAVYAIRQLSHGLRLGLPVSFWTWLAVSFTMGQSIGFASNSYTIWEDEILLFFLSSFGVLAAISSVRQANFVDRVLGIYQSILFIILTRVASLSRLCREEQMPYCRSTFYASANSSTSAPWQLLIPYVMAVLIPAVIRSYFRGSRSYHGSAPFWIGYALPAGLLLTAIFWTLDTADDSDWFAINKDTLKTVKVLVAQLVLAVSFGAGTATSFWAQPCVNIVVSDPKEESNGSPTSGPVPTLQKARPTVTILGYANTHGTRYFLHVASYMLALVLLLKPMGHLSLGALTWQILCVLEILDTNSLTDSPIGPIIFGLLGNYHFFKTGHQATLSSIQWEAAFIPMKQVRYVRAALLVTGNTLAAQILCTIAVPLVALWKQPPKHPNLIWNVGRAMATYLLYHAFVNLTTTMWAAWLRRHLMLYRIFSPRWMVGSVVLLVCDVVGILTVLFGVRWSTLSVASVFGWD